MFKHRRFMILSLSAVLLFIAGLADDVFGSGAFYAQGINIASLAKPELNPKRNSVSLAGVGTESFIPRPKLKPQAPENPDAQTEKPEVALPPAAPLVEADRANENPIKPKNDDVAPAPENAGTVINVSENSGRYALQFPWNSSVASAAFKRGSYIWVAFNKNKKFNIYNLSKNLPPQIDKVRSFKLKGQTVIQLHMAKEVAITFNKKAEGNDWILNLSRRGATPDSIIPNDVVTSTDLDPYVILRTSNAPKPFSVVDPESRQKMFIIPVYSSSLGVYPERRFVDFELLQTAQGAAINVINDSTYLTLLQNGIRISANKKQGATLSHATPELSFDDILKEKSTEHTLYPYKKWKVPNRDAFTARMQRLNHMITISESQKALIGRKKLAELYLSEAMHHEALGILNRIRMLNREFYNNYQLSALRGAANLMMHRVKEAESDFSHPSLNDEPEIKLWRNTIAVMLGKQNELVGYANYDKKYASHYPPEMRRRLAIIAADHAIALDAYNTALRILDILNADGELEDIADYVEYMKGRIFAKQGKTPETKLVLTRLLNTTEDRFIEAHADFTLSSALFQSGLMDRKTFIKNLERVQMIWRGDALELNVLRMLGELYVADDRYLEGLRTWRTLLEVFPGSSDSLDIAGKMADTFVTLFNGGKAKELKPLKALATYYEFRELTPVGKAGDIMIRNLADRLAAIDLLERAAALLEHQIKYRLEGEERSRIGARLALIYLFNNEAEKAINVLKLTGFGNNDEAMQKRRNHLAATAYAEVGETDTALGIINEDYSLDAKTIRMDIYWDTKDWDNVIVTGEDLLTSRVDITQPLTESESQTLLRLAIAYTFKGNALQLRYLRELYEPLLEGNSLKDSFMFITNDRGTINHTNINMLTKDISNIRTFLTSYRSQIRENGLSQTVN